MVLFIDASYKNNSVTRRLAESFISGLEEEAERINLYEIKIPVLDEITRGERQSAARVDDRSSVFISLAAQFAEAEKIIIAAPYENLSYPSVLMSYLEAVMIDGITYYSEEGSLPKGNCEAKELVFISSAGGYIYNPNHELEYIKSLFSKIFGIQRVSYYYLDGLDLPEIDSESVINAKMEELKLAASSHVSFGDGVSNILVVDDSKVNILKTEHILKEAGYVTIPAMSGEECLKNLKMKKIDMILMDIEMPGMNGFETLDEVKKIPEYKNIPVVFVTSDKTVDVVIKASQYNASGYVTKPFTKEELMVHISKAMNERNG